MDGSVQRRRRSTQQERVAKGLCPNCGKEAAPYYLCGDCRGIGKVSRILRRAERAGGVSREMRGGKSYWKLESAAAWETIKWRADPKDSDGRLRPRLGRVPVDVETEICRIIFAMGRPATIEEIVAAWGRLREKRKTESLTGDMVAIIKAQRKREERAAKRLAGVRSVSAADTASPEGGSR